MPSISTKDRRSTRSSRTPAAAPAPEHGLDTSSAAGRLTLHQSRFEIGEPLRAASRPRSPPRPAFGLCVGVTGHRADALGNGNMEQVRTRVGHALSLLEETAKALAGREPELFSDEPPSIRFVSPLADGADQLAAELALELGWELQAILPFGREEYRATFSDPAARERFDRLLAEAACVLELPGDPSDSLDAYVMTGRATVAHCDLMIAVWDGLPPRGRGGTAEVVQFALTRGTAIVHVPIDAATDPRIFWSAFDPTVLTLAADREVERPLDREGIEALLERLLLPPQDPQEREFLGRFLHERAYRLRARIEYPLLLSFAGVRRFGRRDMSAKHSETQVRDEWSRYRRGCVEAHAMSASFDVLEESYRWADCLATHLAQTYRSGHVFNFVLGALAVCMGLGTLLAPRLQFQEAVVEMFITIAIILNAVVGKRNEWHRRWLDYRQLAERLRPMRSLKLLGVAAPDAPGSATNPVPRRWIDWYAGAIWRGMGCPAGKIDKARADQLGSAIAEHEISPQVAYHERNARQIQLLDHRLEVISLGLFAGTLLVSVATLIGFAVGAEYIETYDGLFMLIQGGFPALGTAIFGIRFQGDFGGDAVRSMTTANTLRHIDEQLRRPVTLSRAADLSEQAARVMLSDLDEWRLVNQQRELDFG